MLTVTIFTYKRLSSLNKCIQSLDSKEISEILIFNDDETSKLTMKDLIIDDNQKIFTNIYNPIDFGFNDRCFRKPIYINEAMKIAKNKFVLFSDDDGTFVSGTIDAHIKPLQNYPFSAGGVIRSRFLNKISKSILQGTNYGFEKEFFNSIGGYDENFVKSMGGGDVDFWYRIYNYVKNNKIDVAFLPDAIQKVNSKSTRKKNQQQLDPKEYTIKKHNVNINGPMYTWFKEIRTKDKWMKVINN